MELKKAYVILEIKYYKLEQANILTESKERDNDIQDFWDETNF